MSPRIGTNRPAVAPSTTRRTPAAPPPARAPERVAAPRPDAFERSLGGDGNSRTARTASATYRRHGDTPHDLSDRTAVGQLISRSPQLDDRRSIGGDETRCGGAAMFNAMLLDGNARANACAIETVARSQHVELSASERGALTSMRAGHLTPHEAATLQHTLYRIADGADTSATGRGLTGLELSTTVGALRAAGGFPNTTSANFRMDRTGPDSNHWTVTTTTTTGGTAHADSWPQGNGYASVAGGPGATEFHHGGRFDDAFVTDVTMTTTGSGTSLRTRAISGTSTDGSPTSVDQMEVRISGSSLRAPASPVSLDPATGAVLEDF